MKIERLSTYLVAPRWLFLRIDTDEGITGWGEPVVEGRAQTVAAAVEELAAYLIGADPLTVEEHWQVLTKGGFYRGGPVLSSAVAGVDQALWDIVGKVHGVPVHELLGVRDVLGDDNDLAIDFHGRLTYPMARRVLPLLEPFLPLFAEEPLVPEAGGQLARVVDCTTTPIATGERLYSRWDFRPALDSGVAVVQPDVSHAGGISELRRIAALAEAYDVGVAPHCPLGPIALAASLQVDFAIPNLLIQEQSLGIHYNQGSDLLDYLVDPAVFAYADGYVARPTGPGLGIEVDAAEVERAAELGHRWRSPVWRRPDGSLTEW